MVVAIVTGASRGIGRGIALQLADDGMDVVINDIPAQLPNLEKVKLEIERKGRRSICIPGDVSNEDDVKHMVASTVKELGELNVMVANAGIMVMKNIFDISVEEWDKLQAVNVRGVFLCYREAALQMIAQGKGGKIIGACSSAGYKPSPAGMAYSITKWGVRAMTQATAMELAPHNINVPYCPGPVNTNMWSVMDEAIVAKQGLEKGTSFKNWVETQTALKRETTPEDLAWLVSFLVSPKARNITGQSILCDGGTNFS